VWQGVHQDAVHSVISGAREDEERSMYVSKSEALRTLVKMRFVVGAPPPRVK